MIGLLVRRTLAGRPRRTLLLLLGFGIAVGVMITLLSIGAAVLEQSRDADLVGGGDLVVLPAGVDVEVLKVGAATGMFYAIDNATFVYRHVLSGPRFQQHLLSVPAPAWPGEPPAPPLAAASPILANEVVYVRRRSSAGQAQPPPRRGAAFGVIPSLDRTVTGALVDAAGAPIAWEDSHADRMWMEPPVDSLYHALDRFHRPSAGRDDLDAWAEWLYFAFHDPATGGVAFVSYIVTGDVAAGRGRARPWVQLAIPGEPLRRVHGDMPLDRDAVRTDRCDVRFDAGTWVRFEGGRWHLALDVATPAGRARGRIEVEPVRDLDYPPVTIHEGAGLVSGYVVPAIRARARGFVAIGHRRLDLDGATAYHDHNWGTWRDVQWDWGTASTGDHGLLYGRVAHPELGTGARGAGLFALVSRARDGTRRGGLVGLFRPEAITWTWDEAPPALPGSPRHIPSALEFAATSGNDRLDVRAAVVQVLTTPPRTGETRVFVQARAEFTVEFQAGGRRRRFDAPGFAEVFVAPEPEPAPRR